MNFRLASAVLGVAGIVPSSAQTTPQACFVGLGQLAFDPYNFARYSDYFRADSVITLAQAGYFTGPQGIEEYVRFASPFSPYIDNIGDYVEAGFKGIDGDLCIFRRNALITYHMSGEVTDGVTIKTVAMSVVYYNVVEDYIPTWHVYYPAPYLAYFFGTLATPAVRDYICGVMSGDCGQAVDTGGACQARLADLPIVTGEMSYFDGNGAGCRSLHAVFATTNADHCAHISFEPMEDPDGKIKCQTSAGMQPSDLFEAADIDGIHEFAEQQGLDPAVGFRAYLPNSSRCENDGDCAGVKKCMNSNKCKCKDRKCRKKRKDCATRGDEMEWWGCRAGNDCVAPLATKWGKCKVAEEI